jgi:hypothetical protein
MPTQRKVTEKVAGLQKVYWRASEAREVLDLWRHSGTSLSEFARPLSLEPENAPAGRPPRASLCPRPDTKKPRELSLSGLSANRNVAQSTRF